MLKKNFFYKTDLKIFLFIGKHPMYSAYNNAYQNAGPPVPITLPEALQEDLIEIDQEKFSSLLKEYPIVVVDVWAPWCRPCVEAGKKILDFLKIFEVALESQELIFVKDNIDREETIHGPHVEAVPTFFIYYRGALHHRLNGFNMQEIGDTVQNLLLAPPVEVKN